MKIYNKISILFLIYFVVVCVNGDKWVWSRSNNRPSSQSLPLPPSPQSQSRPSSFYQRLENDYEKEYRRQQFSNNNFINNGNRENFQSSSKSDVEPIYPSINNGFIAQRPSLLRPLSSSPQQQQQPPLPFSSSLWLSNFHNNQQNHLNGILIGPGGPTGIIGRPSSSSNNHVIGNSENGILIGPGGPTGIIGRPSYLQGFSSNCREPIKYPSSSNLGSIYPLYPPYPTYPYSGRSASEKSQ